MTCNFTCHAEYRLCHFTILAPCRPITSCHTVLFIRNTIYKPNHMCVTTHILCNHPVTTHMLCIHRITIRILSIAGLFR